MDGCKLVNSKENYPFWTDSEEVFYLIHKIKNADLNSFIVYPNDNCWAKDRKTVYCMSSPYRNAAKDTFEALNYCFVKDKSNVWTMNGKIDKVDVKTFEVCDSGRVHTGNTTFDDGRLLKIIRPMGYGKDKNNVYYYNGNDVKAYKPKIVNSALPDTFVSMDDGHFGYDENSVYFQNKKLKNANPKKWKLFEASLYSKDKKVYFENNIIKEADVETFEVIDRFLAKDKNIFFNTDTIISKEHFEELKRIGGNVILHGT